MLPWKPSSARRNWLVFKTSRPTISPLPILKAGPSGKFKLRSLPLQAQLSPVYTITALDYNKDGAEDLLLCGNINHARLRFGKYDANFGVLLQGMMARVILPMYHNNDPVFIFRAMYGVYLPLTKHCYSVSINNPLKLIQSSKYAYYL